MSVYSSDDKSAPSLTGFDPERTLANVLTKLHPSNDAAKPHAMMLRCLYKLNPEMFVINGGIHNNPDGSKTYMSIRMYDNKDHYVNLHIYGSLRGTRFNISTMEMYCNRQIIVFEYPVRSAFGAQSPPSHTGKTHGW